MALQSKIQALSQGGRALPCLVKMNLPQRQAVLVPAMLPRPLGVAHDAMFTCASLWAAVCGPDTAFGRVWWSVWPRDREMRVEGRRRSKMAEAAIVADKIEGLLLFVLEAAIDRILKKSARLPLSPQPLTPPRL